jgi:hypothetical protein
VISVHSSNGKIKEKSLPNLEDCSDAYPGYPDNVVKEWVAACVIATIQHGPQVSVIVLLRSIEMFSEQREVKALVRMQGSDGKSD